MKMTAAEQSEYRPRPFPDSVSTGAGFSVFLSRYRTLMMFQYVTLDLLCQPI